MNRRSFLSLIPASLLVPSGVKAEEEEEAVEIFIEPPKNEDPLDFLGAIVYNPEDKKYYECTKIGWRVRNRIMGPGGIEYVNGGLTNWVITTIG